MTAVLSDFRESIARGMKWLGGAGAIVLALYIIYLYFAPNKRAITIEAQTLGVSIEFTDVDNTWQLSGNVVLCKRLQGTPRELRMQMQRNQQDNSDSACGDGPFSQTVLADEIVSWSRGAMIRITAESGPYPFLIHYLGERESRKHQTPPDAIEAVKTVPNEVVPLGSFYLLSTEVIRASGVARYKGFMTIGEVPTSGSNRHLVTGSYEVWDLPRFGRSAAKTLSGPLILGDSASVVKNWKCREGCNVPSEIIIAFDAEERMMQTVLQGGVTDDRLKIDRFGGNHAYIASNWFDRARTDSILIGLSSLVAVFLAMTTMAPECWKLLCFFRGRKRDG